MQRRGDVSCIEGMSISQASLEAQLDGVDGSRHSLQSLMGKKGTTVVFVANGCPTARSYEGRLNSLHASARERGVNLVAINSNNPALSPPDTLPEMVSRARAHHFNFPYLKDADGAVAREFGAVCTPHAFLMDGGHRIVYRGRIDDSRLGDNITSQDLGDAIDELVAEKPPPARETEPFGCSIVW